MEIHRNIEITGHYCRKILEKTSVIPYNSAHSVILRKPFDALSV